MSAARLSQEVSEKNPRTEQKDEPDVNFETSAVPTGVDMSAARPSLEVSEKNPRTEQKDEPDVNFETSAVPTGVDMSAARPSQEVSEKNPRTEQKDEPDVNFETSAVPIGAGQLAVMNNSVSQVGCRASVALDSVVMPSGNSSAFKRIQSTAVGRSPSEPTQKQARLADSSVDMIFSNLGPPEERKSFCRICKMDYTEPFGVHIASTFHLDAVRGNDQHH
ncbi:hypothetical protein CRE_19449 [Caenorhabditis remanei]|uniref:Uncharacterized protein n=1 Tax=Caenorhabditis remanei TaxID=31234 RepID=E3NA16_CAERE|nr:hypothetical protein CRE_19449 [Caenorhabditis remanei]